jgi:hypothetical protein
VQRVAALTLVLLLAGCGSNAGTPSAKPAKKVDVPRRDSRPVTLPPAERLGFWRKVELSPNLKWWLGQWSGECEAQSTYLIPVHGGKPRSILPAAAESYALGWSGKRARILLPRAVCGGNGDLKPGIYLVDPETLKLTLVRRIKPRPLGP